MEKIFKFTFLTFQICGTFLIATLIAATFHHLAVHSMLIPPTLYDLWMSAFKYAGLLTLFSFPSVIGNILIRGWQDEGKQMLVVSIILAIMLIIASTSLMLYTGKTIPALQWLGLWAAGLIVGNGGNKYSIPFENGIKLKTWRALVQSF